jgi:cytosine/adenosine deaminase-related metal-dependent hydrolase
MTSTPNSSHSVFDGVYMAGKPLNSRWDIACRNGIIQSIGECHKSQNISGKIFLAPSLCHPHIHLDKCFLLSHPKYEDLEMKEGNFGEALSLTSR